MNRKSFPALMCSFVFAFLLFANAAPPAEPPPLNVTVDWRRTVGEINRGIFSYQGFMQVWVCKDPLVLQTFKLINPADTDTRLECYIHRMEPENDDDDPNHFNWQKYHPQKLVRFIDDRKAFMKDVTDLGMEPVLLLCYLVEWIKNKNSKEQPINNIAEWAEYAAAAVQTFNGSGEKYYPHARFVEVWNEPNLGQFWTGSEKAYFELFNATARRIHRDYPGVLVGGPALTRIPACKPDKWMADFLKICGPNADFISYHSYGESVDKIISDIKKWAKEFRKLPGKSTARVMMTETDHWLDGNPNSEAKIQYMLDRQFRLLEVSDLLWSVHHFCCLAYAESGKYEFGIVSIDGTVLAGTFWPYWLFRNLIGDAAYYTVQGERSGDLDIAASHIAKSGQALATAVLHNKSKKPLSLQTLLNFAPEKADRVLSFSKITPQFKGIEKVMRVPAGTSHLPLKLALAPGEGLALTLVKPGKPFFRWSDLDYQKSPFIEGNLSKKEVGLRDTFQIDARILNTTFEKVSGTLKVVGIPADWTVSVAGGSPDIDALAFGAEKRCRFAIKANSLIKSERAAPYIALLPKSAKTDTAPYLLPHSIPQRVRIPNPVRVQLLPIPIHAVRGEVNALEVLLVSQSDEVVQGKFNLTLSSGFSVVSAPPTFSLFPRSHKRILFKFAVNKDAPVGKATGKLAIRLFGTETQYDFQIEVGSDVPSVKAIPFDLTPYLDIDTCASIDKTLDYDRSKIGLFVYPADYTPSNRIVHEFGIPIKMASMEDDEKNSILPQGQKIKVPEGNYASVAFVGYGHNGKHPGNWTFHYADGSKQVVASQIPEWCTPPPQGFRRIFTAPYRYIQGGPAPPPCELFIWQIKADPSKKLTAIELPRFEHAYLYAITLLPHKS